MFFNGDMVKDDAGETSNYHCTEHPQSEEVGCDFRGTGHMKRENKLPILVFHIKLNDVVQQTFSFLLVTQITVI